MPIKVLMPALSPTMTEGNLARWLKKEGDNVKSGDVLAEIETDKATMEVEAVDEGKLGKILVKDGAQGVKVNDPIAVILEEGEDPKSIDQFLKSDAGKPAAAPAPAEAPKAEAAKREAPTAEAKPAAAPAPAPAPAPRPAAPQPTPAAPSGGRVFASPLAKRVAKDSGIDLSRVTGSGPHGRVVLADVEKAKASGGARAGAVGGVGGLMAGANANYGHAGSRMQPHTTMRKVIAQRLTQSKQTVPHFYATVDCEIDRLLDLRAELNALDETMKLSVNDFVIKATALALMEIPDANASWSDQGVVLYDSADVSVAVAIPGGLITPIITSAEKKGLAVISKEMKDLAQRAKENKLKPEEFQGGTFSISNMGMFGVKDFSAIINPPQGAILAIAAGEKRPVVKDGKLDIATVMSVTISCDHRVIDGALGAQWLQAFKKLIEHPIKLVL
jgi:pyruvate dehydrogenase E2 component (dihydrolipoamide acetyltransferase)